MKLKCPRMKEYFESPGGFCKTYGKVKWSVMDLYHYQVIMSRVTVLLKYKYKLIIKSSRDVKKIFNSSIQEILLIGKLFSVLMAITINKVKFLETIKDSILH